MNRISPVRLACALAAILLLGGTPVLAATEPVGRVLAASGLVVASTPGGATRTLDDGSRVYSGEIITTHRQGQVQIRFQDGALVSLRPNTRFEVVAYDVEDAPSEDGGNVLLRLFKGALRTITGVIGDDPDDRYRLDTPVATIGIRGTQYAVQFCTDTSCGPGIDSGLYGRVVHGRVVVGNQGGQSLFDGGTYFRVAGPGQRPRAILRPPRGVLGGLGGAGESGDSGEPTAPGAAGGGGSDNPRTPAPRPPEWFANPAPEPEYSSSARTGIDCATGGDCGTGTDPSLTPLSNSVVAAGFIGEPAIGDTVPGGGICRTGDVCGAAVGGNGNVQKARTPSGVVFKVPSSARLVDSGHIGNGLDITWGHWRGTFQTGAGGTFTGDMLWAYSGNATTRAQFNKVFSATGSFTYTLAPGGGGPALVSSSGTTWTINDFSIRVRSQGGVWSIGPESVLLSLAAGNATVFLFNPNAADIGPQGFQVGLTGSGAGGQASGSLEGIFIGDRAGGILVEIGIELTDLDLGTIETIEGVKVLVKGPPG